MKVYRFRSSSTSGSNSSLNTPVSTNHFWQLKTCLNNASHTCTMNANNGVFNNVRDVKTLEKQQFLMRQSHLYKTTK